MITPAALELLRLVAQRPIPASLCDKQLKRELRTLGYALPELSTIQTMDKDANGELRATMTRDSFMLCITDAGKDYLAKEKLNTEYGKFAKDTGE